MGTHVRDTFVAATEGLWEIPLKILTLEKGCEASQIVQSVEPLDTTTLLCRLIQASSGA